jgi:hypothetical protein
MKKSKMKKVVFISTVFLLCSCLSVINAATVTQITDNFSVADPLLNDATGNLNWYCNFSGASGNQFQITGGVMQSVGAYAYYASTRNQLAVPAVNKKIVITFKVVTWGFSATTDYWRVGITKNQGDAATYPDETEGFYVNQSANGAISVFRRQLGNQLSGGVTSTDGFVGAYRIEMDYNDVKVWFNDAGQIPDGLSSPNMQTPHGYNSTTWSEFGGNLGVFFRYSDTSGSDTFAIDDFSVSTEDYISPNAKVLSIVDNFDGPDDTILYDNTGDTTWSIPYINNTSYLSFKILSNQLVGNGTYPYYVVTRRQLPVPFVNEKLVITFKTTAWAYGTTGDYWRFGISKNQGLSPLGWPDETEGFYLQQSAAGTASVSSRQTGSTIFSVGAGITGGYRIEMDYNDITLWYDSTGSIPDGSGPALGKAAHGYTVATWSDFGGGFGGFFRFAQTGTTVNFDDFSMNMVADTQTQSCNELIASGQGLATDLNYDCYVDIDDMAIFVANWLACNNPQGCQ